MNIEEDFRFDTRIRDRMLKRGEVKKEELETRLQGLPDREEEAVAVELEQPAVVASREEGTNQ